MPLEVKIDDCNNCKEAKHILIIDKGDFDVYKGALVKHKIMTEQQLNMIYSRSYGEYVELLNLDSEDIVPITNKLLSEGCYNFKLKKHTWK